jgi:hypothetical protein
MVVKGDCLEPVRLVDEAMSFVRELNEANPLRRGRVALPSTTPRLWLWFQALLFLLLLMLDAIRMTQLFAILC